MTTQAVRVEVPWLQLREPADALARSSRLARRAIADGVLAAADPTAPTIVHDLGAGTGATLRWLAPQLAGRQHWVLHDRDPDLLEHARVLAPPRSSDGSPVTVETRLTQIGQLRPGDLSGAHLVTASALADLLCADELAALVDAATAEPCPLLVTLSVVGRVDLHPADPLDARVGAAFDAHQRRMVDGRPLLGPDAVDALVGLLQRAGRRVVTRPSQWRLGAFCAPLTEAWLAGWVGAAVEHNPGLESLATAYLRRRRADLAAGTLSVVVHHRDVLAVPS